MELKVFLTSITLDGELLYANCAAESGNHHMTYKIAVNCLAFLHTLLAIPCSITPPERGNPEIYFLFSSDPLRKSWENILKLATTAFFLSFSTHQSTNRPCVLKANLQSCILKKAEASMEQACS
jgi:hypothetical protein